MKHLKTLKYWLLITLIVSALPAAALAQPDVFFECAYPDPASTNLTCQIIADTAVALRSGGVMVTYDTSILTIDTVTKDGLWEFTDGATTYAYMDPEVIAPTPPSTIGSIVFIVGVLNTTSPAAGIPAGRAKIGDVVFLSNATPPADPTGNRGDGETVQATFFGLSAELGRGGDFVNFVSTAGAELDGAASFAAIAAERGDANASGNISTADYITVRNNIGVANAPPYVDCNGIGGVSTADYICVRNKI